MDAPSLDGFAVGVTADRRAEEQIELLARSGARVVHGPTVRTLPLSYDDDLRTVTQLLVEQPPDFVLASTGIGIRAWFSAADVWGIGDGLAVALAGAEVFARGARATNAVLQAGLRIGARSASERLDEVVELLIERGVAGRRIAFPRHGDEAPEPLEALARAGAVLVEVPVGEWTLPDDLRPALRLLDAIIAGTLHAVTFTSAPAVRNLFLLAEEFDHVDDLRTALDGPVVAVCVGPVCVTAARRCGVRNLQMPTKFRLEPMVRELADVLTARVRHFHFAGHEVVLRGSVIEVDTTRIELADREAGVLRMLTTNPGVPLSKRELLHEVWGDRQRDDHVVEVTVARLRRRLGDCSDVIVAVPRRGYRFEGVAAA